LRDKENKWPNHIWKFEFLTYFSLEVVVRYVGRLPNGKIFDQTQNRPFTFTIGRGEVIKGWDMGFEGMQVGGHRTMIIPSKFGYGAKGAPPSIPPHTNLTFDVELVAIK